MLGEKKKKYEYWSIPQHSSILEKARIKNIVVLYPKSEQVLW